MFLNIITPCRRYKNLMQISKSINIPRANYRWIIVFDSDNIPEIELPENGEYYFYRDINSKAGNAQRNFAFSKILNGHVYCNDDDTILHPELWNNIKDLDKHDFISFSQNYNEKGNPKRDSKREPSNLRLKGNCIRFGQIDSHNYIFLKEIGQNFSWDLPKPHADGLMAVSCFSKATNPIFIDKVLSIYNSLR